MRRRTLLQAAGAIAALPTIGTAQAEAPLPRLGASLTLPDVPLLGGGAFLASEAAGQVVVVCCPSPPRRCP